jgi:UDP-N-acetylglucosamine 4-epimerase
LIRNEPVYTNGDGETSRDFCYIDNVVQANILAATTQNSEAINQVYNVAVGGRTTLNQLIEAMRQNLIGLYPHLKQFRPIYRDFRAGDVRHSQASIVKSTALLGYQPTHIMELGLKEAMIWYIK